MNRYIFRATSQLMLLCVLFLIASHESFAAPAAPVFHDLDIGQGKTIKVRPQGDEWSNRLETISGHTIAPDANGKYFYVQDFIGNNPVLSGVPVTSPPPQTIRTGVKSTHTIAMPLSPQNTRTLDSAVNAPVGKFKGNIVFILVKFNNQNSSTTEASWGSFVKNNIRDYFSKASYGKVNLVPARESSGTADNGVIGWLKLNMRHPNTAGNTGTANQLLTKKAIIAANPYINYAAYDRNKDGYVDSDELSVVVVVAGQEAAYGAGGKSVWGHAWAIGGWGVNPPVVDGVTVGAYHRGQLGYAQFGELHDTHQATMGIMVHELGHLTFGLPDLYDIDYSSSGIGYWGVMGGGSWGKANTDKYWGARPVLPSAWTKTRLGWATKPLGSGKETIVAAGDSLANSSNTIRKAATHKNKEYFLVENRKTVGYDKGLQGLLGVTNVSGLAIWHIDDNQTSNSKDRHRWVDLEKADNKKSDTKKNLWYAGNSRVFNNSTIPDSRQYNDNATNVAISSISLPKRAMTAYFKKTP